jgi:tetratricopeptide (TPR) repeat protein
MKRGITFCAIATLIIAACAVSTISENDKSAQSRTPQDRTKKRDIGIKLPPPPTPEPLSLALVIGISRYQNLPSKAQLQFADADAQALRDFLVSEKGGFKPENVTLLVNNQATRVSIIDELRRLQESSGPKDLVLIFFAGHGVVNSAGQGFLLAYDSRLDDLLLTAVEMDRFNSVLKRVRARSVVIISDACHSGTIGDSVTGGPVTNVSAKVFAESFSREDQSSFIFSAAAPMQSSLEVPALKHGLFTYYLLQGLEGEADRDGDGLVSSKELYDYVAFQVREEAKRKGHNQIPEFNPFYDRSIPLAILNEDGRKKYKDWIESDPFVSFVEASFREALSGGKLTTPEKESAWSYYNKLVEYSRRPQKLVEQMRRDLLARLRNEAQAVIDQSPTDGTRWDEAGDWFDKAFQMARDETLRAKKSYCACMARFYSNEAAGAERECENALSVIEENRLNEPFLCLKIAQFYKNLGKWERACRGYKLAVENHPNPPEHWFVEYAEVLIQKGDPKEAEVQLRQAERLAPDYPKALKLLAEVLLQSGQKEKVAEAVKFAERAHQLEPNDVEITEVLGRARLEAGDPAGAVGLLREVALRRLSDNRRGDEALLNLSRAYRQRNQSGDLDRAISALQEARRQGSKRVEIYDELSTLLYERGNLESAIAVAEEVANLTKDSGPEKARRLRTVAEYLERAGRLKEAAERYKEAAANLATTDARLSTTLKNHACVLFHRIGRPQDADCSVYLLPVPPKDSPPPPSSSLIVPGGLEALEYLTGIKIEDSNKSRTLTEVFERCLRDREMYSRLRRFYQEYLNLAEQLKGKAGIIGEEIKLPPPGQPLSPAAHEVFKFFGVKDKGSERRFEPERYESRKQMFEALGGDPEALRQKQPTFVRWKNGELSVLFGMDQWRGKIKDGAKAKPNEQLLAFLKDQRAMQLYVGLSMLPEEAAYWLFINFRSMRENADALSAGVYFAAPYLRFTEQNQLYIPGGEAGKVKWQQALGTQSPTQILPALFKRENGGALYLFAALSAAGKVGDLIARSNFFDQFYRLLKRSPLPSMREPFDLIDLFSHLRVENDQLRLRSVAAESWLRSSQAGGDPLLALLSKIGGASAGREIPVVRQIAVLAHIERERPDWVSLQNPKTIELIANQVTARREPQLELALDLQMSAQQLERFFLRVEDLEKISPPDKKLSVIRTFQAAFELLRLMARNGTLDQAKLTELADQFLKLDPSSDGFAVDLLAVIKRELLDLETPASGQEAESKLVASLAESKPLVFQNRRPNEQTSVNSNGGSDNTTFYHFNSPKADEDRIMHALKSQKHTRFASVVNAVTALDVLEKNSSDQAALHQLQVALGEFIEPEPPPVPEKEKKKKKSKRPEIKPPSLKELAAQAGVDARKLVEVRRRVAPFVGEALLGVIYAAMLNPEIESGSDLVLHHDFSSNPWGEAQIDSTKKAVRGSVARLSYALAQLESSSSSSPQALSISPLAATFLNSYQLVDRRWVTSRGAEYVARSIDLGEDVLALSILGDRTAVFLVNNLEDILSPRRATAIRTLLNQLDVKKAIDALTSSERYYLGQQYFESKFNDTSRSELVNKPGAVGALTKIQSSELNSDLRCELRQFGMTMTTRAALARLDLKQLEPYEQARSFRDPNRLAERIQDVKLTIARTCYRQGCCTPLPLSLTLARGVVRKVDAFNEDSLALFLTELARSPYTQPLPDLKWSDDTVQAARVSTGAEKSEIADPSYIRHPIVRIRLAESFNPDFPKAK